jgi:hypothetical protein
MAKRKLDGRRRQWYMVALADDVDVEAFRAGRQVGPLAAEGS